MDELSRALELQGLLSVRRVEPGVAPKLGGQLVAIHAFDALVDVVER